jgi:hypothetical protein
MFCDSEFNREKVNVYVWQRHRCPFTAQIRYIFLFLPPLLDGCPVCSFFASALFSHTLTCGVLCFSCYVLQFADSVLKLLSPIDRSFCGGMAVDKFGELVIQQTRRTLINYSFVVTGSNIYCFVSG